MKKRQTSNKKKILNKPYLYYINILIILSSIILLAFLTNQFILSDHKEEQPKQETHKYNLDKELETKTAHEKFEEQTQALEIEYIDDETDTNVQHITKPSTTFKFNDTAKITSEEKYIIIKEKIPTIPKKEVIPKKKALIKKDNRPLLAILIDDVTISSQVRKITDIGYPITMAFLPPTKLHKNSAKITKQLDRYMIHLPLEAGTKRYEETNTLHIGDSLDKIEKRIKYLKSIYPKAKYINNHTGSKFTSNRESMNKLMQVLKKYNYIFLDSRTTAKTKAKIYAKKYGVRYLSRNIFLDNKQDKNYIQNQLKKAIKIAKKKGIAIAIGHPHSITLKTLKSSKYLLKDINLVYINSL